MLTRARAAYTGWLAALGGIVVAGLGPAAPAAAGTNEWSSHGPDGGLVRVLAVDPRTPTTLYAATSGGVFKSLDGGTRWTAANRGLGFRPVVALAVDPVTPATLYAATEEFFGGGVFKSADGGATWRAAPNSGLPATSVSALALDALRRRRRRRVRQRRRGGELDRDQRGPERPRRGPGGRRRVADDALRRHRRATRSSSVKPGTRTSQWSVFSGMWCSSSVPGLVRPSRRVLSRRLSAATHRSICRGLIVSSC